MAYLDGVACVRVTGGPTPEERTKRIHTALRRYVQRSTPSPRCWYPTRINATRQFVDNIRPVLESCPVQRRQITVGALQVGPARDEQFQRGNIPAGSR